MLTCQADFANILNMTISLEQLGLSIKRVQDRHHRVLDARLAALGISLVQWNALREIERNPGSPQLRLAELTFNSAQAFGTLVTRLQRLGFVKRESGEGRAFVHTLTPKGQKLLEQGRHVVQTMLVESFSGLNEEERVALSHLLGKMLDVRLA